MYLEIISPEKVLFKGQVASVTVPGANGEFQMLNNHAAILSTLTEGIVKFVITHPLEAEYDTLTAEGNNYSLKIKGGVVEMNDNKVIILPS
ncbi:MAG: F0F1 ATP synthase subunit epsilon [Bacteroidota bacterium]